MLTMAGPSDDYNDILWQHDEGNKGNSADLGIGFGCHLLMKICTRATIAGTCDLALPHVSRLAR